MSVTAILVALALGVLASGCTASGIPTSEPADRALQTASPSGGPSVRPAPPASPDTAGADLAPTELSRSAIPWPQVGAGWMAATWLPSGDARQGVLFLVSPAGIRYRVADVPNTATVVDVSPDGRRILTAGSSPKGDYSQWDTASGTQQPIPTRDLDQLRFTKPSAKALLGLERTSADNASVTVQQPVRLSLDGTLEASYGVAASGVGGVTQSPDGLEVLASGSQGIRVYGNATGVFLDRLATPVGSCEPVSWWPDGRLVMRCNASGAVVANLWLAPLDGSAPVQLTRAGSDPAQGMGYADAWPGTHETLVQDVVGCGSGQLGLLGPDGRANHIDFARTGWAPGDSSTVVTVYGDTAYLVSTVGCGGTPANVLARYDLTTGQHTALLGPGVNGGTVGPVVAVASWRR